MTDCPMARYDIDWREVYDRLPLATQKAYDQLTNENYHSEALLALISQIKDPKMRAVYDDAVASIIRAVEGGSITKTLQEYRESISDFVFYTLHQEQNNAKQ